MQCCCCLGRRCAAATLQHGCEAPACLPHRSALRLQSRGRDVRSRERDVIAGCGQPRHPPRETSSVIGARRQVATRRRPAQTDVTRTRTRRSCDFSPAESSGTGDHRGAPLRPPLVSVLRRSTERFLSVRRGGSQRQRSATRESRHIIGDSAGQRRGTVVVGRSKRSKYHVEITPRHASFPSQSASFSFSTSWRRQNYPGRTGSPGQSEAAVDRHGVAASVEHSRWGCDGC